MASFASNESKPDIVIVGGGLVGSLLALLLAPRARVRVYEQRPDIRQTSVVGGRSINLVMTSRGLNALERAGIKDQALNIAVAVKGRMMHSAQGALTYQPYGSAGWECNYSVSRTEINRLLITQAEAAGVQFIFNHQLHEMDAANHQLTFHDTIRDRSVMVTAQRIVGADGGGSRMRGLLAKAGMIKQELAPLGYSYKELMLPAHHDGSFRVDGTALHIWPRGSVMLMALPNRDGSFTGTLYLPDEGPQSFAALDSSDYVLELFRTFFGDAIPLFPNLVHEMAANPTGSLGTVWTTPWYGQNSSILIGDAAHAIVPFFGQGMNCGFEDCVVFSEVLERSATWEAAIATFYTQRKANTDAIAAMSLENFQEMKDAVADPRFLLRKKVEQELERRWPDRFRSRYALVAYTLTPYAQAYARGQEQAVLLDKLCVGKDHVEDVDFQLAGEFLQ